MSERLSIVLAEHNRASCLKFYFGSMLKHSRYRDHEIVFIGDLIDEPIPEGWLAYPDDKGITMREYLQRDWIDKFNIQIHEFKRPNVPWGRGSQDYAIAYNQGVKHASHDWIVTQLDSDCYFFPDWDINVIKHFSEYDHNKYMFTGVMCGFDLWHRENELGYKHLGKDFFDVRYYTEGKTKVPLRESTLMRFYEKIKRDNEGHEIFIEPPGNRFVLGWLALYVHRDIYEKVGGYREDMPGFKGADIAFDDALRDKAGVMKVGCLQSFIFHNGQYTRQQDMFIMDV